MIYIYNIYDITYILYISTHLICIQNPRFTLILILTRHAFLFFFFFFSEMFSLTYQIDHKWTHKETVAFHRRKYTPFDVSRDLSLCVFSLFQRQKLGTSAFPTKVHFNFEMAASFRLEDRFKNVLNAK